MTLKKMRLDYKWVILVVCFLMEFMCLGFCSSNMGLYTVPVTSALGIDRLAYSCWSSIRYAVQVVTALFFGTMVNRFGVRKMVFVGAVSMISATLLRAFGTNVLYFYLAGALHGFGITYMGGTMAAAVVRHWFKQDIGKYTGIVMSANGIGGAIAAQIISPIINNGETFGYRKAYLLSAAIVLVVSALALLFIRDNPAESADLVTKKKRQPKNHLWAGMEYTEAKKRGYFYFSAALIFLTGISLQSIGSITIVYMTDLGISAGFIASMATVSSLVLTCSKLLAGASYDKWGLRTSLLICQIAALTTFVLKGCLTNSTIGLVLATIATLLSSLALPLETVMVPLLTNDLFGSASYDKILGIFMAMNSLGLCLGSPLGELIRRITGNYRTCFWIFSILILTVIVCWQFVLRTASKVRNEIVATEQS